METVKVLNIDIQNMTRQELLENLKEGVLVTLNLDHLIKLQKDREFYDVYQICIIRMMLTARSSCLVPRRVFFLSSEELT